MTTNIGINFETQKNTCLPIKNKKPAIFCVKKELQKNK